MPERELTDAEASALGLSAPNERELSDEEAATLGLNGPAPTKPDYSKTQSAFAGAAQGGSLGFVDEANALEHAGKGLAIGAASSLFRGELPSFSKLGRTALDTYRTSRDANRAEFDAMKEANPKSYFSGELAGGAVLPMGPAGTLGQAVKQGAKWGAAYGFGSSEADLTEGKFGRAAVDTGLSATTGGLGGAAVKGVIEPGLKYVGSKVPGMVSGFAERRAAKAAGFIQKDLNQLDLGEDQRIGRELLDRGLIKFGRKADELLPGFEAEQAKVGGQIGEVLDRTDALTGGAGPEVRRSVAGRIQADADARLGEATSRAQGVFTRGETAALESAERQAFREGAAREAAEAIQRIESSRGLVPVSGLGPYERDLRRFAKLPSGPARDRAIAEFIERAERVKFGDLESPASAEAAKLASRYAPGSPEAMSRRSELVGELMEKIPSSLGPGDATRDLGFPMRGTLDRLRNNVLPEFQDPARARGKAELERLMSGYADDAEKGVSFSEAREIKTNLQELVRNWLDDSSQSRARQRLSGVFGDEIEEGVGRALGPETRQTFEGLNQSYGRLKEATGAAGGSARRDAGNRIVSPSDYGAALAGSAASGGAEGVGTASAFALAHKILRERGSSMAAVTADKALPAVANKIADLARRDPGFFRQYAQAFRRELAQNGAEGVMILYHALMQEDPEWAKQMPPLSEGGFE